MYIVDRGLRFVRGFILSYGPTNIKKIFWDKEYSGDKWNFADNTKGDCVYRHLEKFAANKTILDIGCGSGNTPTEMAGNYKSYVGVDISKTALAKAAKRSQDVGRGSKNSFECSDFLTYVPSQQYDVILFRESLYHVPISKIKPTLDRYAAYLKEEGVFIVRLFAGDRETDQSKPRPTAMLASIEADFDVLEKGVYPEDKGLPTVIVFRPKVLVKH
jgi:2-polyprenyl-3-methyl-5-hydroxy-6-metoxy-1,4-benzoquinol methylase